MITYQSLEEKLGFESELQVSDDWSAAADFLNLISDYCIKEKPAVIVECSSGTSSIILARCCQLNASGHVYSLENGEQYVEKTRRQLEDFALKDYCDVLYAPLKNYKFEEESFQWYETDNLPEVEIDMLVIDGPPGFLQKQSRYPALPLLYPRLADNCRVFLDDAARDDENVIVKRWLNDHPDLQFEYVDNERGCSILKRT